MGHKFDLLLDAANYIEVRNGGHVQASLYKVDHKKTPSQKRIKRINQLKLKRGAISKTYSLRLQDIILGFNKNIEFLKSRPLETIYLDQLIEIGVTIRNITSITNSQYDCCSKNVKRGSESDITKTKQEPVRFLNNHPTKLY